MIASDYAANKALDEFRKLDVAKSRVRGVTKPARGVSVPYATQQTYNRQCDIGLDLDATDPTQAMN